MGGMGGLMDPSHMATLMQNPAIQTMMQQMLSSPEFIQQVSTISI